MRNTEKHQEEFKQKFLKRVIDIHGDRFDLSKSEYKNNRIPIFVKCNECGTTFKTIPFNLLKLKNCPMCSIYKQRKTTVDFICQAKQIHGNNYNYSKTIYTNAKTKVDIECNSCKAIFQQLPRGHLYEKSGCPFCKQSHGEEKISLILKFLNIRFNHNHKFKNCVGNKKVPLKFDFYLPDFNMCIEFDGKQHTDKTSKYWSLNLEINDKIKTEYCCNNGIKLKRIPFTELKSIEEILKIILK